MYIVKTKKPQLVVLQEKITKMDRDWIKQEVKNLVRRCEMVKQDESLVDIIFPENPDSYVK